MPKTLADMTPGERKQCVGMWSDYLFDGQKHIGVLLNCDYGMPVIHVPSSRTKEYAELRKVTPRFDLPRAWNADGTPPAAKFKEEAIRLRNELVRLQQSMRYQPDNYLASEVANAIRLILEGEK